MKKAATLLLAWCLTGCAGAPVGDATAQRAFEQIEARLLAFDVLRVDYSASSSGVYTANLDGDLVLQKPAMAAIESAGDFAGAVVQPVLVSDGIRLRGGSSPEYFEQPLPADLRSGLLLGLTRMGVLHNLAMLSGGAPPDGTDGNVRDWVRPVSFAWQGDSRRIDGVAVRGISFSILVGGTPSGDVVLWFDPQTGLPVAREQLVYFDEGEMRVVERYAIETDGMIGPCRFDLDVVPAG